MDFYMIRVWTKDKKPKEFCIEAESERHAFQIMVGLQEKLDIDMDYVEYIKKV